MESFPHKSLTADAKTLNLVFRRDAQAAKVQNQRHLNKPQSPGPLDALALTPKPGPESEPDPCCPYIVDVSLQEVLLFTKMHVDDDVGVCLFYMSHDSCLHGRSRAAYHSRQPNLAT